ncbi:MAG TPA: MFS transporter [Micromonosporaceae bacterium]|nr:MFS transporter [Micromonosporaceae bacterium]
MTTAAERATYRDVFADPIFRVLFLTRSVAIGADTLRILALSVLVFAITGSPLLTAVTFGIGFVPQVIGGTLLGSLADRLPPRGLIISGYLLECAVATVLGTVRLPVAVSLALVGLVAMLTPIFAGASNRLVAETLRGDAYVLGRSLSSVASGAAQLAGMALGGVAVAALGPQRALLASAACHLAVAVAVRLGLPRLARPTAGTGSAVRQGWAVTTRLLRDREVRGLLLVQWVPPAFVVAAEALVVPYVQLRGFPAGSAGLLLACAPAGMLLGNVVVGRMLRPATRERLVVPLMVGLGTPVALLAAPVPMPVVAVVLLLAGATFTYSLGIQRRFLEALDEDHRGHAFALLATGLMTLQGVGPAVIGAIAEVTSIGVAMVLAGAGTAACGLIWSFSQRRASPGTRAPEEALAG